MLFCDLLECFEMARHIFSSFLFASLIILISPLPSAAGDASQAELQDAEPAASVSDETPNALSKEEAAALWRQYIL